MIGTNKRKQKKTKKLARDMRARVLAHCKDYSAKAASSMMGLGPNDVANLRAGNGLSLLMLVRLVKHGRFSAQSLVWGKSLRRLPKGSSTRGVRADLITKRVSKIAIDGRPLEIAKKSGFAAITLYLYRTKPPKVASLHTILSLLEAGYTIDRLLFGRRN